MTQPGLPRAYYNSHPRVNALVSEAQRGIAQVAFTAAPSRAAQGEYEYASSMQASQVQEQQLSVSDSPYLPVPQVGSGLNMGGFGDESSVGLDFVTYARVSDLTLTVYSESKPARSIHG